MVFWYSFERFIGLSEQLYAVYSREIYARTDAGIGRFALE